MQFILIQAIQNPLQFGMTKIQHDRIPEDRQAMISLPIMSYSHDSGTTISEPIGTLALETSTHPADTQWMEQGFQVSENVSKRLALWETVIRRLLN